MHNSIIYGKNELTNIVSIEPKDNTVEVFTEENGIIKSTFLPHKYWLLSNQTFGNSWVRLKGDLFYKYGRQFDNRDDFYKIKRLLRDKQTFCIHDPKEAFLVKDGYTYYKGLNPKDVSILSFDIETTGLEHNENSDVLIISNTFRKNGKQERKLFTYDQFSNTGQMIDEWCKWVREINPSIMIAHNGYAYDLPYLNFVAEENGTTLKLGRDDSDIIFEDYESKFRKDATQFYHYHKAKIYGREIIDTLFLALKYDVGRKYETYGLKNIIKQENLEIKDRVFYDASKIRTNYKNPIEWEKIKAYAEFDADDALALYDLMIPPFFYMAQSVPKSFQSLLCTANGSQINSIMIRSYLQNAHSLPKASETLKFEGAVSFGNPGIYRNVFKIDVASLYPSVILEYKIYDKEKDPNGHFLQMVDYLTTERLKNKELAKTSKYHDDLQNAQKISINSAYGFLGAPGLLFNSTENAALITKYGRDLLKQSITWAENKGFKIVNADTDSISFSKLDASDFTEEERSQLLNELNSQMPEKIKFTDDGYYLCVIVVKAKNYLLWDGKKIKYKGSAIKAPGKELALREFINELLDAMLNHKTNYAEIYNKYVKEAMDIVDINRWATRKTITANVLNAKRTNEQKILDAISGMDFAEGDRIYTYFKEDGSISLAENFKKDYNKDIMLEKLYKTSSVFDTILPEDTFINYKLKRNKKILEELLNE